MEGYVIRTAVKDALERHVSELSSMRNTNQEDKPFFVIDLDVIKQRYSQWLRALPNVIPHYAVKCNSDPTVLRLLADLGAGFDCASAVEMESALHLGIEPAKIIYAHPCKSTLGLNFARNAGITRMTFDSVDELEKVAGIQGPFELLLRIWTDDNGVETHLSQKFGARLSEITRLLQCAQRLGLNVIGIAFHVGTNASDPLAFIKAIRDTRVAFRLASNIGIHFHVLDIGGGFTSRTFEASAIRIRETIVEQQFPRHMQVIAEPGRMIVEDAFTLACMVIGRRGTSAEDASSEPIMLYLSDGVYGSFANVIWESPRFSPGMVDMESSNTGDASLDSKTYTYSLWGPTCDGTDRLMKRWLCDRDIRIGHWLYFPSMGAYSSSCKTNFNGFGENQKPLYISGDEEVPGRSCIRTMSKEKMAKAA